MAQSTFSRPTYFCFKCSFKNGCAALLYCSCCLCLILCAVVRCAVVMNLFVLMKEVMWQRSFCCFLEYPANLEFLLICLTLSCALETCTETTLRPYHELYLSWCELKRLQWGLPNVEPGPIFIPLSHWEWLIWAGAGGRGSPSYLPTMWSGPYIVMIVSATVALKSTHYPKCRMVGFWPTQLSVALIGLSVFIYLLSFTTHPWRWSLI